jgi:tetratricopeptide (TPR) repeat protein
MRAVDVNSLFARAERAFVEGRPDAALADLQEILGLAGQHPAVLHLLALVQKKLGNLPAARKAFEQALALAPHDPQIANNAANLLGDLGEWEAALSTYDRAIAAASTMVEARLNRAICLHRLQRFEEARAEFERVAAQAPGSARLWSARGAMERDAGDLAAAAGAFDHALSVNPAHELALRGRARVALERGEHDASDRYLALLQERPDDPEINLAYAEALEAEGKPGGIEALCKAVRERPGWVEGHNSLARMRSEAGETDIAASYREAANSDPSNRVLWLAYADMLAKASRYSDALAVVDDAKAAVGADDHLLLKEALWAGEAGDVDRASSIFQRLEHLTGTSADLARARHFLRLNDPERASALIQPHVAAGGGDLVTEWAHLLLAWRMLGDARKEWLCPPELYGAHDLDIPAEELAELAETLRALHRTRAHPVGQSLRGGTQTRGSLFNRPEPILDRVRERIRDAVETYRKALPAVDSGHPLLQARDRSFKFAGSWSVRLTGSGFHVSHIHPQGLVSSAFYVSLPSDLGSGASKNGWLEIGGPPAELDLKLSPLATIEPRPGRLALFPSYLYHGTRPFEQGERLTIAFDLVAG